MSDYDEAYRAAVRQMAGQLKENARRMHPVGSPFRATPRRPAPTYADHGLTVHVITTLED